MTAGAERHARVICVEGVTAVGKTTLAQALAAELGAAIVPELDASGAPPIASAAKWFVDRHAEQWRRAVSLLSKTSLVVLDGDPFKGLWYNWVFADGGWEGITTVAPLYREHLRRGTLGFPDLYVVLLASEAQLRARREGDQTRRRRNFDTHVRLLGPHERYFEALRQEDPRRVLLLDSTDRDALLPSIQEALEDPPAGSSDPLPLLERMAAWIASHDPGQ
jgi:thymidylate kinase